MSPKVFDDVLLRKGEFRFSSRKTLIAIKLAVLCYWKNRIGLYCFLRCIDENPDGGWGLNILSSRRHVTKTAQAMLLLLQPPQVTHMS